MAPTGLITQLRSGLALYDGKSPEILVQAANHFGDCDDYVDALIAVSIDQECRIQEGAAWLLKAALESGHVLNAEQLNRLLSGLGRVCAWQAQLHICQSAAFLEIPPDAHHCIEDWLLPLLSARRPFLRAWALNALCKTNPDQSEKYLDQMAGDPAASVRARVRNLRKQRL